MARISELPSEIYTVIFSHIPPRDRQKAVLNLTRALPRSPIPRSQIFDHIIVYTQSAALHLYKVFRSRKDGELSQWNPVEQVKSVSIQVWSVNADIVGNLLALLPSVPIMQIFVGTTYSPEHLYDIFSKPRLGLRSLHIRFKPYVEKATYLPFLQGAYFDSTLLELSKWPVTEGSHLRRLCITQDTISYKSHIKFAQPIVFFSFKPLSELSRSPVGQYLEALRIAIPAKPVTSHLASHENSFPRLEFLDISTTALPPPSPERAIGALLETLAGLKHIVIDRNAGTLPRDSPGWASLGRTCALAGVGRAKRKEKEIQEWMDAKKRQEEAALAAATDDEPPATLAPQVAPVPAIRARRGRRGLATATISLRDPQPRSGANAAGPSSRASTNRDDSSVRRVRIVPSPPTLRTFSTAYAGPSNPTSQQRSDWSQAFQHGFMDGCRTLNAIWKRVQDSSNVRVMRFTDRDADPNTFRSNDDAPAVLRGVADIAAAGNWVGWEPTRPNICFGSERAVKKLVGDGLAGTFSQMGIGDSEPAIAIQGSNPSGTPGIVHGSAVSGDTPSAVGGLWDDEEFIEWGPGHTDGCGHNIGRQIFE